MHKKRVDRLVATSSESFALNLKIYVPSTKKRLFAPL